MSVVKRDMESVSMCCWLLFSIPLFTLLLSRAAFFLVCVRTDSCVRILVYRGLPSCKRSVPPNAQQRNQDIATCHGAYQAILLYHRVNLGFWPQHFLSKVRNAFGRWHA